MKVIRTIPAFLFVILCFSFMPKPITWKVKDSYAIEVKHDGFIVGNFTGLKANIVFDEEKPENSSFSATIDAATLNNPKAKEHLAVAKYKTITFVSTAVKRTKEGYEATGKLTLKGITKETKLPFSFDSKNDKGTQFPFKFKETFYGTFSIVPKDFNINEKGVLTVELTIPVTK